MRGINMEWPFSQLILTGAKTEVVFEYNLDDTDGPKTNEEVLIVESKGTCNEQGTISMIGMESDLSIARPPTAPQVVGSVTFNNACIYNSQQEFHDNREYHRIPVDSNFYWDGIRDRYAWRVDKVITLRKPITIGANGMSDFDGRCLILGAWRRKLALQGDDMKGGVSRSRDLSSEHVVLEQLIDLPGSIQRNQADGSRVQMRFNGHVCTGPIRRDKVDNEVDMREAKKAPIPKGTKTSREIKMRDAATVNTTEADTGLQIRRAWRKGMDGCVYARWRSVTLEGLS
jgi:hypothetical protein